MGLSILLIVMSALLAPSLYRHHQARAGWWLASVPAGIFLYYLGLLPQMVAQGSLYVHQAWLPSLGVDWSFYLDGLSMLFVLLVTGFGTLIVLYAAGYLKNHIHLGRFYLYFFLFMAAMLGVVLASNLLTLFVFWELTSLSSFFLIGYYHNELISRKSALQALLVTGIGGLLLLVAFLIIGNLQGGYDIVTLLAHPDVIKESGHYGLVLGLLALGAFTKSAQFPFHFWLPNAMAAPTPVSAFLHSATMVKAGVFLLARFYPMMAGTPAWTWLLSLVGGVTAVVAAVLSLKQSDMKTMLAYSTVMALGVLVALLGVGSEKALAALVVFLLAHALYKATLFMTAGTVHHEAGSRDIYELAGLGRKLPLTFTALGLAALSMAGLPLAIGFIGKELIYKSVLGVPWLLIMLLLTNVALFASSLVLLKPFWGRFRAPRAASEVHEAPLSMVLGPLLLALLGVLTALVSLPGAWHAGAEALVHYILKPAASAIAGSSLSVSYHLIPKLDTAFMLSLLTFALGTVVYLSWVPLYRWLNAQAPRWNYGPAQGYAQLLRGITRVARAVTAFTQSGNIHREIIIVTGTILTVLGITLLRALTPFGLTVPLALPARQPETYIYDGVIILVLLAGAITTVFARRRLTAITALGATGAMVALTYTVFAAPDLAITQFMIETLTVVIIALVMVRLPSMSLEEGNVRRSRRLRDAAIAIALGLAVTVVVSMLLTLPLDMRLSEYFAQQSVPKGKGHNIVNVILVDFRGVDTMGEITVLSIAALGVFALLQGARRNPRRREELSEVSEENDSSPGSAAE